MNSVLIWLGAGRAETPIINFDKFEAVLLVEARSEQVEELQKQFRSSDNVKIVHSIISDKAQKSYFCRYSLDEYSALTSTTGLTELYPGLKLAEREEVKTQFVVDILNKYVDQTVSITLVLDILDVNHSILKSIIDCEYWQRIEEIYLPIPEFSLYENAASAAELLPLLNSQGFELSETDSADPDIPIAELNRNPLWLELESLKKQQQLQNVQHQKLVEEYENKLQAQISDSKNSLQELIKKFEFETSEFKKREESSLESYKQLSIQKDDLSLELEQVNAEVESLKAANGELNLSLESEKDNAVNITQQLERKFTQDILELQNKNTQHAKLIASLQSQNSTLLDELDLVKSEKQQLVRKNDEDKKIAEQHQKNLSNKITELSASLEQKSSEFKLLSSSFEIEKSDLIKQVEFQKTEKQQLIREQEQSKQSLSQLSKNHVDEISELTDEIKKLEAEIIRLDSSAKTENADILKNLQLLDSEKQQLVKELDQAKQSAVLQTQNHRIELEEFKTYMKNQEDSFKEKAAESVDTISVLEQEKAKIYSDYLQVKQTLESEIEELTGKIKILETVLVEQTEQRKCLTDELLGIKKQNEDLSKEIGNYKDSLKEREQSSDLTIKLHTKTQLDLDDLREKFAVKYENEQKLVELVKNLREKLQQAAEYYDYLQLHHPELEELKKSKRNTNIIGDT